MEHNLSGELQELTGEKIINNNISNRSLTLTSRIKRGARNLCSKKTLKKRLPCLTWIPEYKISYLVGDCIAGLTVSLLIIPQALAYGLVAGLSPNYGLYSSFVGGIVYFFFGSTNELNIGPTAIMSLMTYQYSRNGGADCAILLCFLAGVIELLAAIVNLGFFINFISQPVISGFTSAAAITIASSQLKGLFGLTNLQIKGVFNTWYKVCYHIKEAIWQDFVLGVVSILTLTIIKYIYLKNSQNRDKDHMKKNKNLQKFLFYSNVAKNTVIIIIASIIAYCLDGNNQPFTLTGEVAAGIPSPQLPPFSTTINNHTMTFEETVKEIGSGVITVPLIAILYDVAVVSAFSKGKSIDVTQEIVALGIINLIGSFFRSMPTSACLSRTALNTTSGVHTPAAGLLTAIIVLIALAVLTPYFRYIPRATLAAVIICSVMQMFDTEIIKFLWKSRKMELIHLLVTFVACLLTGLEWGILIGIGTNLACLLFKISTPTVSVDHATFPQSNYPFVLVTPNNGMLYPSATHIRTVILKAGIKEGNGILPVVVDCSHMVDFDFTSFKVLIGIANSYKKREQPLIFLNIKPSIISKIRIIQEGVTAYNSLEDVENILYNYPKRYQRIDLQMQ